MTQFDRDPKLHHDYNARESVADFDEEFGKLLAISGQAQTDVAHQKNIVFDPESGSALDLYPAGKNTPVFVWIHGGYWRMGDKEGNAFAAPGLVANGISVAIIDYSLAPAVNLEQIVHEVRTAIGFLYREGPGMGLDTRKIHVGGSSAGGHLTGAVLADGWRPDYGLPSDMIGAALALSGIYDLEPLLYTYVNEWMDMDMGTVAALSPIRYIPDATDAHLVLSVGGTERDGFLQETANYRKAWEAKGHKITPVDMPTHNHFDITGTLADPDARLVQATLKAIRPFH